MLNFLESLFFYIALNVLLFSLFLFLGLFFLKLFKFKKVGDNDYFNIAFSAFIGIVLSISTYSLIKTSFLSINIFSFLIILLMLFYNRKQQTNHIISITFKPSLIFELLIIICVFTFYELFFVFNIHTGEFVPPHTDFTFSSNISYYLNKNGGENCFMEASDLFNEYKGITPYHYFEIWGAALISKLFSLNALKALLLSFFPIIYVLNYLLLLSFINTNKFKNQLVLRGFIFISLFVGSFYFNFFDHFKTLQGTDTFLGSTSLFGAGKKYCYWITIFLIFFYYLRHSNNTLGIIILCFLPVFSITSHLPILGLFIILLALSWFIPKNKVLFPFIKKKQPLLISILFLLLILLFYQIVPSPKIGLEFTDMKELFSTLFSLGDIQTKINIVIKTLFQLLIIYLPFIVFLFLQRKIILRNKFLIQIFIACFILLFSGLLIWAAFSEISDSVGFFASQLSIFNIVLSLSILLLVQDVDFSKTKLLLLFLAVILVCKTTLVIEDNYKSKARTKSKYSNNYINKIISVLNKNSKSKEIFIGTANYDYSSIFSVNSYFSRKNTFLFFTIPKVNQIDIGASLFNASSKISKSKSYKHLVRKSLLTQYMINHNYSINIKSLNLFIKDMNIKYFICQRNYPNCTIDSLTSQMKLLFEDSISKEGFFQVK